MDRYLKKISGAIARISRLKPVWFWTGFGAGMIYFGAVFWWLWSLHPLTTIGIQSTAASLLMTGISYAGSVIPAAGCWGLFSWFAEQVLRDRPVKISAQPTQNFGVLTPWMLGGGFAVAEYLRSWVFGIVWAGNGGSVGSHWTFGNPAYWLVDFAPVRALSMWLGMYGTDLLLACLIVTIILGVTKRISRDVAIATVVVILAATGAAWIAARGPADGSATGAMSVALVQTRIPTVLRQSSAETFSAARDTLALVERATTYVGAGGIVVLPEGSGLSTFLNSILSPTDVQAYFKKLSVDEFFLVDNVKSETNGGTVSRTVLVSSKDGLTQFRDKLAVAPGGEYVPFLIKVVLGLAHVLGADIAPGPTIAASDQAGRSPAEKVWPRAVLIACSEVFDPGRARDLEATVAIGVNSVGLFRGNRWLEYQLLQASRLRAAENRIPVVWASNSGRSYIINSAGNITTITASAGPQILTGTIAPRTAVPWYTEFGDWPSLVAGFTLIGASFRRHHAS